MKILITIIQIILIVSSCFCQTDSLIKRMNDKLERLGIESIQDKKLKKYITSLVYSTVDSANKIQDLQEIPLLIQNDSSVTYEFKMDYDNQYSIKLSVADFDSTKHTIGETMDWCVEIDNQPIIGEYYGIPDSEIKNIEVFKNNKQIGINENEYSDLYNAHVGCIKTSKIFKRTHCFTNVFINTENDYIIILLVGSDGESAYEAYWAFRDGDYLRRIIITGF